ncbi:MAG TPA: hypothetical protein DCX60_05490 [Phycisphaerales bacterium]|nr:hypothetical protein [Phycisphaerales bacterium]
MMNRTARKRRNSRRGSALLMVTIAMASSIVLAGAYVASRSDGTVVGANLASSSDARNRAESALAITSDLLTRDEDWRTGHVDGVIIDEQTGDHGIKVTLTDLATGGAPDLSTVDVGAEIIAHSNGIERIAEATFFVPLPAQSMALDLDLGEFALFAGADIQINSEAVVAPWDASPATHRGDPIRIATMLGRNGGISIGNNAAVVDGVEFSPNEGSMGGNSLPVSALPDQITVPAPAPPQAQAGEHYVDDLPQRILGDVQTQDVELGNGDVHELLPGSSLLIDGDLQMSSGATLRISGASEIVVTGDVAMDQSSIEVPVDAALTLHIGGNLEVRDSSIHEPGGTSDDWVSNIDRIRLVSMAARESIAVWKFRGSTLMKGECYAPSSRIVMRERSMIVGRLLAHRIRLDGCARLLYDPSLDDRNGYTASDGRLFDDTGRVPDAIREIETLAPEELVEASLKMNALVVGNVLTTHTPTPTIEADQDRTRLSRRERRLQRHADRIDRMRDMMHQTVRQLEAFMDVDRHVEFERFSTQSSMRVRSIGSPHGGHSHGGGR